MGAEPVISGVSACPPAEWPCVCECCAGTQEE